VSNAFNHSKPFTIGIEEEYMICDPITGELIDKANDIISSLDDTYIDRYSYELILSEIEVNTNVHEDVKSAIDEIAALRRHTRQIGKKIGFNIGISGTHPTSKPQDQKFVNNDSYNWVAKQLGYYAQRNITFSMHVHISTNNAEETIHITNSLRRWIAPILSLSTNSPFFSGFNTEMRSSRILQFGSFPRTNIPRAFKDYKDYEKLVNLYIETKSIEKPRQVWWKLRPHMDYGTIEFRICDVQRSLSNAFMLAAISQALVYQSSLDYNNKKLIENYDIELLNDALWKASRFNMNAQIIDPVTSKQSSIIQQILIMQEYIQPALSYFDNMNVNEYIDNIISNGTESDKQIKIYNETGFEGLKKYLMSNVEFNYNLRS
tara:strand:+ start:204 stop:1331 length:1128 start_codon:yes stop_codon:yes gene_type:complete